ncbi:MAG: hypothetical protein ACE5JI_11620 [Acidobacteriota bacterium]
MPTNRRLHAVVVGLLCIATTAACASTKMTSMLNPEVASSRYSRIVVAFPLSDLELRKDAELTFAGGGADDRFLPSHQLFFPGKQYSEEEIAEVFERERVDAVLAIGLSDAGSSGAYIPQTSTTSCSLWSSSQGCLQTTTTAGGFSVKKPWANFVMMLLDTQANVVWVATASTGGNALADSKDLVRSMAKKTREQLARDGLIR